MRVISRFTCSSTISGRFSSSHCFSIGRSISRTISSSGLTGRLGRDGGGDGLKLLERLPALAGDIVGDQRRAEVGGRGQLLDELEHVLVADRLFAKRFVLDRIDFSIIPNATIFRQQKLERFFYLTSYNYEQNISIRYRQLQYAKSLTNKIKDRSYENLKSNTNFSRGYYYDDAYINGISLEKPDTPKKYSREENITTDILSLFRINISNAAVKEEKFDTPNAADTSFFYNSLLKDASGSKDSSTTYMQMDTTGKYLAISSAGLNYKVPSIFKKGWFGASLFWSLLLFMLL